MDLLHEFFGDAMPDETDDELAVANLTRIESSELRACFESFAAQDLVDAVASEARPFVEGNHNQLLVHCPSNIGAIESDRDKVRLVLGKLLENAALNTEAGRIDLVVMHVERDGLPYVDFRVSDTGIGMSKEEVEKLFHFGDGLELAIARCLCLVMGGDLSVESTLGAGTTFDFTLPVYPPEMLLDDASIPAIATQRPRINAWK